MLPRKQRDKSFLSVRKFAESMDKSPDSFLEYVNVLVQNDADYYYLNIHMGISYHYDYMDYRISLFWEEDNNQVDYSSLGLHGYYSTNFQEFSFSNGTLVFTDGTNKITIMPLD